MGLSAGSLASASLGMQAAGAGMQTVGAFSQAQGQKSLLNSQADMDEVNARIAEASARSALVAGQRQQQASQLQTAQTLSTQRASLAANGVDLGTGSAAEIQTTTKMMGEVDANTIAANALRQAWGYRTQAVSYQNDALMRRASADSISPFMAATSTLLGSAGNVASSWYRFSKDGVWSSSSLTTGDFSRMDRGQGG
jgi:hypothetical protein